MPRRVGRFLLLLHMRVLEAVCGELKPACIAGRAAPAPSDLDKGQGSGAAPEKYVK